MKYISFLELVPVVLALHLWADELTGKKVQMQNFIRSPNSFWGKTVPIKFIQNLKPHRYVYLNFCV
jgi:hypothetical protein